MWRMRLRRLLQEDSAAANTLRELLDEITATEGRDRAVHNEISGGTVHGHVLQGRDSSGPITLGTSLPPEEPDARRQL